jgi:hypothetical protein
MTESDRPTCGKGLAENSILPARLGKLLGAMAENLEVHRKALDLRDPNSQAEYEAYAELIQQLQKSAGQLESTANQMAGYRDLPMGKHDEQAMIHPKVRETFENFVQQKQALLSLLGQTAERDRQLLEVMHSHSA